MTDSLSFLIDKILQQKNLIQGIFSSPFVKTKAFSKKVLLRPILKKNAFLYQITEHKGAQAFHKNLKPRECKSLILKELFPSFRYATFYTKEADYLFETNQQRKTTFVQKPASKEQSVFSHNRKKNYLLSEAEPLSFLIELGIMNSQGKVLPSKADKFRQINRFLEMVSDILPHLKEKKQLHIIDFGCGKAYLTFALYYYLTTLQGFEVHLIGLDLKTEVIQFCQVLAEKLGYTGLKFLVGDILDYSTSLPVDLVVSLHACDTATDVALAKAIHWKSKVILSVPCCHKEIHRQLHTNLWQAVFHYGILKERFSALITDAARAQLLEKEGYSTQVMEFVEPEATAKNLLIRAAKGNTKQKQKKAEEAYLEMKQALGIFPSLERLLAKKH